MPFSLNFAKDIDPVVITESSRHLIIVHGKVIFLDAPQFCQSCWVYDLKHSSVMVLPCYIVGVTLGRVIQQLLEEVPQ